MKVYKIRDAETGLFSTGGTSTQWTKSGKTWSNIGHVKSHIRQYANVSGVMVYKNAEVVTLEVKEDELETTPVKDILLPMVRDEIIHRSTWNPQWSGIDSYKLAEKYLQD